MRDAYAEVFRTYWLRIRSIKALWILAALTPVAAIAAMIPANRSAAGMVGITYLELLAAAFLWVHFSEQMVGSRRWLGPGHLRIHLLVFGVLSLILVIVAPAMGAMVMGIGSVGFMACVLIIFAWLGWWLCTWSQTVCVGGLAMIVLAVIGGNSGSFREPIRVIMGQDEFLGAVLLVAAIAVAVLVVVWLCRIREEDAAYRRRPQFNPLSLRPRMTGDVGAYWSRVSPSGWLRPRSRIYIPLNDGRWEHIRRWRSLIPRGRLIMLFIFPAMLLAPHLVMEIHARTQSAQMRQLLLDHHLPVQLSQSTWNAGFDPAGTMWLVWFPVFVASTSWMQLWRYFEVELVRPIDRAALLKELGAAIAISVAQAWLVFALGLFVMGWIINPWPELLRHLMAPLAISVPIQIFMFGSLVWAMRYKSMAATAIATIISLPACIPVIIMAEPSFTRARPFGIAGAFLICLVGIFVIRDAYRRWLVVEFG